MFLTIATGVLIPIILAYQAYGYWVFRGKVDFEQEATAP
jgi:cytochrome bd-type quinol oxidase subunit 2